MKSLKEYIIEALQINEATTLAPIKKLGSKAKHVTSKEFGDGWLIGDWVFPYSEDEAFDEMVDLSLNSFGAIVIGGKEWKKHVDMDGAMEDLKKAGQTPKNTKIGFVFFNNGPDYPVLMNSIDFEK